MCSCVCRIITASFKIVCFEKALILWVVTWDSNGSFFVTHDPWSLPLRMGHGGGVAWWHWTITLSVLRAKKSWVKVKPPAMIIGLTEWVSSFLMSSKNKKKLQWLAIFLQATAQLFHHGSMGHWQWPIDPFPSQHVSGCADDALFNAIAMKPLAGAVDKFGSRTPKKEHVS